MTAVCGESVGRIERLRPDVTPLAMRFLVNLGDRGGRLIVPTQ